MWRHPTVDPLVALLTTSIVTGIDHQPEKIRRSYACASALGDGATLSLGVEAIIRRSRRLGGTEATLRVRTTDVGAPFAARAA
jgi:hypothetical protein